MTLTQHPLSAAFPAMDSHDFDALLADIREHGQREPAALWQGQVLDGWHRVRACMALGIEPKLLKLAEGTDPAAYVLSKNLHRRHLNASQRALAIVTCTDWARSGRPKKDAPGAPFSEDAAPASRDDMAKAADVSRSTIAQAKVVATKAAPEVRDAVRDGKMSVKAAVKAVKGTSEPKRTRKPSKLKAPPAPAPAADEADDLCPSVDELIDELQADNERLVALLKVAEQSDLAAEAIKWRRMYDDAVRKQADAMDAVKRAERREAWNKKQLMRCGRAVDETDPDKIAAAVEAFVRAIGRAAA
ncbi:MAG: hypothetical protein KDD77_12520 [Caldilineaceae bacterium]|nr:hypothetical protein [Caldilineaceae bacterium]